MSYKITPEEIRNRASAIASIAEFRGHAEKQILKLLEDATGGKIPEPFDESKVKLGAVFCLQNGDPWCVVTHCDGGGHEWGILWVDRQNDGASGCFFGKKYRGNIGYSREAIVDYLKNYCTRHGVYYAGQYDFAAGLPK